MSESAPEDWIDPASHDESFVETDDGRLHMLDWGGDGPPLVLLHGSWASPHAFDAIASRLAEDFRVIAYARRGHGQSSTPDETFDLDDLVEDLGLVMDAAEMQSAHLLGWSIAGYEITRFAVKHPERVEKLVFLEGHYEFGPDEAKIPFPLSAWDDGPPLMPDSNALASVDAYIDWYYATILPDLQPNPAIEAWLRDRLEIARDGSVRERRPDVVQASFGRIVTEHPRAYSLVGAPVLALFAEAFLAEPEDTQLAISVSAWNDRFSRPGQEVGMERFRAGFSDVSIRSCSGTSHESILFMDPDGLSRDIRDFLLRD